MAAALPEKDKDTVMEDAPASAHDIYIKKGGYDQAYYKAARTALEVPENDYYGLLGLKDNCTQDDIKSRYRKIATLTHTDKNRYGNAKEAFQSKLSFLHDELVTNI